MKLNRRHFLGGLGAAAGAASMNITMADPFVTKGAHQPIFVYLFLRGGMDGLSLFPPRRGVDYTEYVNNRPNIHVRASQQGGDDNNYSRNLNGDFGVHPRALGLRNIYNQGDLAIIHSCGHPTNALSRSHFESMEYIELGTPGNATTNSGWLARYLETAPNLPADAVLSALATSSTPPSSLLGRSEFATLASTNDFHPNNGTYRDSHLVALQQMYAGAGPLDQAVTTAVDTAQLISSLDLDDYQSGGSVPYPNTGLSDDLSMLAQLIKLDLGISVATVDIGGWDDHRNLGDDGGGSFGDRIANVADSLNAFWSDIKGSGLGERVFVVCQTEFGRRFRQNNDRGVDHGSGVPMMVIGGSRIFGGQFYGEFRGLRNQDLLDGEDVWPTTDYRQVLAELMVEILGNGEVDYVFPGFTYNPVGFAQGDLIFQSGFQAA